MAKRILVVDDDVDFQEAAELILRKEGYQVVKAANGKEALDKLNTEAVDLILLDVMMESDTEGFHLAYKLRQDEKFKNIPIVILTCIEEKTGVDLDPDKSGDFLPIDAYLRKPLDAELLKAKVAELVK